MTKTTYFKALSFFLIGAGLLAACGGTLPPSTSSAGASKVDANLVAFTGIVEAISGSQWTVDGQTVSLDPHTSLDPNIAIGDEVKVEAKVSGEGAVVVLKIESAGSDDVVAATPAEASSTPDPSGVQAHGGTQGEIFGPVEAITAETITVNGVTYRLESFTGLKDMLRVGDQVRLHLRIHADGTLTVREVERTMLSSGSFGDNSNSSGSDAGPNHDVNDDHSNDNANDDSHNGSDDHGNDEHGNDHKGIDHNGSGDD